MLSCPRNLMVLFVLLLITISGGSIAHAKNFLICYENTPFPPYLVGQSETTPNQATGIIPTILTRAITAIGLKPVYVGYPWKRCLKLLKLNEVDGLFASVYKKTVKKLAATQ